MRSTKRSVVVGVFRDRTRAEEAVRALHEAGFKDDQISLISKGKEGEIHEEGSHAGAGAATGVAVGAGAAALTSLGISFGVIPVIGPVLAMGPLAAALLSAAGGAVAGGLVGALVGYGIPEKEAKYYEGEVQAGRTLVTVKANGRTDEAWSILQRYGAYNQQTCEEATTAGAGRGRGKAAGTRGRTLDTEGEQTMKVQEEELRARKTPVQKGEARVRKEVVTEQQNVSVPVEREEVVIERRPASGRGSASDIRAGDEIRIPVKEEEVHVEKEPVVKEEVRVGKRKVRDTKNVSGTVRKERVKVEEKGDANVRGDAKNVRKSK